MVAYSLDLRVWVVCALDSGMRADAVAARFEVSRAWVYRLARIGLRTPASRRRLGVKAVRLTMPSPSL